MSKYCRACGTLLNDSDTFCFNCGAKQASNNAEINNSTPSACKYLPGEEPEEIQRYLAALFHDLDNAYPGKNIVFSKWNHERWDKIANYLCKSLGYKNGTDFLNAYGYSIVNEQSPVTLRKSPAQTSPPSSSASTQIRRSLETAHTSASHKRRHKNRKPLFALYACVVVIACLIIVKVAVKETPPSTTSPLSPSETITPNPVVSINTTADELYNILNGVWVNDSESTASFFTFVSFEDGKWGEGSYPGSSGISGEIVGIKEVSKNKFLVTTFYPEAEYFCDHYDAEYIDFVFELSDDYRHIVIDDTTTRKTTYKYVAEDLDGAIKVLGVNNNQGIQGSHPTYLPNQSQQAQQPNYSSEKTVVRTYSFAALQGAVITQSDTSTGELHYRPKCEKCGNLGGETMTFVRASAHVTSFYCGKCGNSQPVKIECNERVEWQ